MDREPTGPGWPPAAAQKPVDSLWIMRMSACGGVRAVLLTMPAGDARLVRRCPGESQSTVAVLAVAIGWAGFTQLCFGIGVHRLWVSCQDAWVYA